MLKVLLLNFFLCLGWGCRVLYYNMCFFHVFSTGFVTFGRYFDVEGLLKIPYRHPNTS